MAGSSSGWYKSPGSAKGRVFISADRIRAYYGVTSDADVAALRRRLRDGSPRSAKLIEDLGAVSAQPAGQAKSKVFVPPVTIPQIAPEARAKIEQRLIAGMRRIVKSAGRNENLSDDLIRERAVATMRRVLADTEVSMRVPSAALSSILNQGFKNQHATNTSRMLLDPKMRASAEKSMFGIPAGSPPEAYPIYGMLTQFGVLPRSGVAYGDVVVTFKESVKGRATVSVGDSLGDGYNGRLAPFPFDRPGIGGAGDFLITVVNGGESSTQSLLDAAGYWEAQIHGPTTASDIARITFTSTPPTRELREQLDRLGIPWSQG